MHLARYWAVVLAGALAPAVLTAAPASPSTDKDKTPATVDGLRKALDQPISIKIERQSLTAAVEVLKEKSKINFVLDTFTIQQMGFNPDAPPSQVDVDLKEVKLKTVLRTILQPYGLSYAPLGDTVLITTEDQAINRQLKQRVNVELDKVEFGKALRQLSRDTAVNLLLDSRVDKEGKNEVSLELEDVPLETAVRLLSEMAGLKPVRIGNVLFVTKKETANEMRSDPDLSGPPNPGGPYPVPQPGFPPGVFPGGPGGPPVIINPGAPAPPVEITPGSDKPDKDKDAKPDSDKNEKDKDGKDVKDDKKDKDK
jgi:hypothetical protein